MRVPSGEKDGASRRLFSGVDGKDGALLAGGEIDLLEIAAEDAGAGDEGEGGAVGGPGGAVLVGFGVGDLLGFAPSGGDGPDVVGAGEGTV